jgi:hypothetical protein
LIVLLREGTAPARVRAAIARGTLPLPPAPLLESLDILADDPDPVVQAEALASLERLPAMVVRGVVSSPAADPGLLGRLARRFSANETVALDLARNGAIDDATAAHLATLPFAAVLEVIGRNQQRLERSPETVAALLANPETPLAIVGLWQEHAERRAAAGAGAGAAAVELDEEDAAPTAVFAPVLVEEDEAEETGRRALAEANDAPSAKQLSIYAMLKKMTMGQKVALAVKGNREVRNLLIHEANRMLCLKVLENPRLSEGDVEAYAKSTNVSVDVLRGIANKKEWCKQYAIVKALVCNPRVPLGISLDFIKRLTKKDLDFLAKNRNVPETLRTTARRLATQKQSANQ